MFVRELYFHSIIQILMMMMVMMPTIKHCFADYADLPMPSGVNYCGVGYNIIEGNPEGGDLSTGGVDPGLLLTRRIFDLTFEEEKKSADQQYRIPDQINFVRRNSVFTTSTLTTFYGTQSYASKLSAQVSVEGGYESLMASVQFAASARYERVSEKTSSEGSVFLSNETITNLGSARYRTELADQYGLDIGFVADACRLTDHYDEDTYMNFLDDWGTHVVIKADLGIREGENLEETRSSFVNYAAQNVEGSVSASGGYGGFSASLSVDMGSFTSAMDSETSFGSSFSRYRVGSESLNEPISVKLIAMAEIFEPDFWSKLEDYIAAGQCSVTFDVATVKAYLLQAMERYAVWKRVEESTNPDILIGITWPEGVYGLPGTFSGCPNNEFDFIWNEGSILQVGGPSANPNAQSSEFSEEDAIWGGWFSESFSRQDFCMKTVNTVNTGSKWQWQPGSYCIYKYGPRCPQGFESGSIYWERDDHTAGIFNDMSGVLPAGVYEEDTEIEFRCRNDGVASHAIHLPVDNNFMLFARYDQCQLVHGMSVRKEWIYWGTENQSRQTDVHPFNGLYGGTDGVRLIYCYYYNGDTRPTQEEIDAFLTKFRADILRITALAVEHGKK